MTEQSMRVSRDVIVDLLPLYLAGEASGATRSLVEQYLSRDEALAMQVRLHLTEGLGARAAPAELPPELELRSLSRTRTLLRRQRWLFGVAIGLSVLALTSELSLGGNRVTAFHFLIQDYPLVFGPIAAGAIACWLAYVGTVRRLRARP
jgi:anti-sigma factor RsiW